MIVLGQGKARLVARGVMCSACLVGDPMMGGSRYDGNCEAVTSLLVITSYQYSDSVQARLCSSDLCAMLVPSIPKLSNSRLFDSINLTMSSCASWFAVSQLKACYRQRVTSYSHTATAPLAWYFPFSTYLEIKTS